MDDEFIIVLIGLFGLFIAAPIIAIIALVRSGRLRDQLDALAREVETLKLAASSQGPVAAPEASPRDEQPAPPPPPSRDTAVPPPPPPPPPVSPPPEVAAAAAAPATAVSGQFERNLTSRWLVWFGAVTMVLAGVFLVKYSIDQGWLSAGVRCVLGVIGGLALMVGGEWLRRQPLQRAIAAVEPNYVPPALAGAGVAVMYTSVYAAYGLYDLLAPLAAFLFLAGVSVLAFGLALLHGPFIAVLGVVGGFLIPLLVSTGNQSALALFPFLLALTGAAQWIVRYRAWWRIAWLTLAGTVLWPLLWYAVAWEPADAPILAVYQLLVVGLFLFVRQDLGVPVRDNGSLLGWRHLSVPDQVAWVAAASVAVLTFTLVRVDGYETLSLIALGVMAALYMFTGRRDARFDGLAVVALVITVALFALWHLPQVTDSAGRTLGVLGWQYDLGRGPIVPPTLIPYAITSLLFAGLFAAGGFVALWGARRPWLWASVSAAAPLFLMAIAFWRIQALQVDLKWAVAGLLVAGVEILMAERLIRYRDDPAKTGAIAAYAFGASAALGLAFVMAMEQAWLTVALALQLPVLVVIHDRLSLPPIRRVAWVVAAVVLVRLALNYRVLDYDPGLVPGLGWMIYGYGVPMVAFYWAARRFRVSADDGLVQLLEAGAIAFATLLVTFEIRHLIAGSIGEGSYSLLEMSLQSIAWLAIAYALFRRQGQEPRIVQHWAWRILASLSVFQVFVLQVLVENPLFDAIPVGDVPVFNLLLLAYGVPALMAVLFMRAAQQRNVGGENVMLRRIGNAAGGMALMLLFVELSLEVRRAFHGSVLGSGYVDGVYLWAATTTDFEWYAYSLAWLAFAGILFALGIRFNSAALRWASLGLLALTALKLFIFDMSNLTGLYRVASFLGLGLSSFGIVYLYQRFIYPPSTSPATPDMEAPPR